MKKTDLKNGLQRMLAALDELVEHARKLDNQNLADIAASARNKVQQVTEHPDLEMIGDDADPTEVKRQRNIDGEATFLDQGVHPDGTPKYDPAFRGGAETMRVPSAGGAATTDANLQPSAPFPGVDLGAPAPGTAAAGVPVSNSDPEALHPGDPKFNEQPNNVDLNEDGTLKAAPNSKGTAEDNRDSK